MVDAALQALLDPTGDGEGIILSRRVDEPTGVVSSYYCEGNILGGGKYLWVDVPIANTDAQKNSLIRGAFGVV